MIGTGLNYGKSPSGVSTPNNVKILERSLKIANNSTHNPAEESKFSNMLTRGVPAMNNKILSGI